MIVTGDRVLIGLSGGPDSVCLLTILNHLKADLGITVSAVYIDHGLRPDEVPVEIDFCRDICGTMEIPFHVRQIDVKEYAVEMRLSKQEAARELRYRVFENIRTGSDITKIALGHNADDQMETIFMRLVRGTGPSGLSGMRPVRGAIIRPLIESPRSDIEAYLDTEGIGYMVDSSNLRDEYIRNRIRHAVVPVLKAINLDVVNTISKTAEIVRDEEHYFDILVNKTLIKLLSRKTDRRIEIFLVPLLSMETVILRRVLRRAIDETKGLRGIGFLHIEELISLIKKGNSGDRMYLPGGIRAIRGYATFTITSEEPARISSCTLNEPGNVVIAETAQVITASVVDSGEAEKADMRKTVVLDADRAPFPLMIRMRRPGDFFYPFGFGRKKKLQDFFVDEKIPRDERDAVPVVECGRGILWIAGLRADARFAVDKSTRRILLLKIKP